MIEFSYPTGCSGARSGVTLGVNQPPRARESPDPSTNRGERVRIGTAYRMRGVSVSCDPNWVD